MSQRTEIEDLLETGKGYDEIEDTTGSKRSYIRSVAVQYRKRAPEDEIPKEEPEHEDPPKEIATEKPSMNFIDDTPAKTPSKGKTGLEYHKEWVTAAKYECGHCGATVGRTSGFCPHCGNTLNWEGIE